MNRTMTLIMAGGAGTRLSVLADRRAKPAVPFGGIYRIVDFTLSNVMHSGARIVGVITQYRPYSLVDHLGLGEPWGLTGFGRTLKTLSPHTGAREDSFYLNTADAIYRNIEFIERFPHLTEVLILSGDHIYRMDYRPMIRLHRERGAALTVATQTVPWKETSRFGIMETDATGRIRRFQEKPPSDPIGNQASLGIYVFDRARLVEALREDQATPGSSHDFGADIIPRMIREAFVQHYDFTGYWRDVGTISAYMETSMEALRPERSGLDLEGWGLRTNHHEVHLADQRPARLADGARATDSLVAKGCVIEGDVSESILSPGVRVGRGARVRRSVVLHGAEIGEDSVVENAIVDKNGAVGRRCHIGDPALGDAPNEFKPQLLDRGITVIGKGASIGDGLCLGRNALIYPGVVLPSDGPETTFPSGATCFSHEAPANI